VNSSPTPPEFVDIDTRALVCQELAAQLERAAELLDQVELQGGWARHFRRDAELLRMRAQREAEAEAEAEATIETP